MHPDHWEQVQDIFHRVVDLDAAAREAALQELAGNDPELMAVLRRMVAGDARVTGALDAGVSSLAAGVLGHTDVAGTRVGPYTLTHVLGEGGMGVVYRGERDDLPNAVAIKLLPDAWLSPARRERFLQEQRTLAQLHHPGIAQLHDAGTLANGTPWIAMELVEGVALTQYARDHQLTAGPRLRLLRRVCDAVLHAHQHLVIHRDLKPSNVLVLADGTPKLLDFGIAKQLDAASASDRTRTGLRVLTPAYASPEQLRGGPVGVTTDVYALGVLLFELLTGELPYDVAERSLPEAAARITESLPPRPSLRPGRVAASHAEWADLDVLVATALQADAQRRYRSVEAFARDIDAFLDGAPLEARPDSLGYRTAKFYRRHRSRVLAGAVAVAAVAALVTFYTVRLARARDVAVAEQVRAQRIQRFMSDLFRGRDEDAGPADSLRVVTLLDQGVLEARTLDREPAVQADLYETLGGIFQQLGQLDRADSLLTLARDRWRGIERPAGRAVARATLALGDLRTDQARHAAADTLLREALSDFRANGGGNDLVTAEALVFLGRSLIERGAHDTAMAVLDTAVAMTRRVAPGTREHLRAISELANARFYAGEYDAADSVNREVLDLTKRLHGEKHPLVAEDLMNLGATEQERGNYQSSEKYFRDALAITTAFHGENHYRTAGNVTYLGRSLLLQNRYDEARVALTRALAIRENVYGPDHPAVANTLNELGSLAIRESRYEDAEKLYARVLSIYTRAYPGKNFRTGVGTANLGDTFLYRNDFRRAEAHYREALTHYIASQGPEHLNTGIGYIKLGRSLLRQGRLREAEPETRRGYAIVAKVASPNVSFLQAARLDLSLMFDSLGRADSAAKYKAEREKYLSK